MYFNFIPIALVAILVSGCATTTQRYASPEDPFAMPIDEFKKEQSILHRNLAQGQPRELDAEEWDRFEEISARLTELIGDATELEQFDMAQRRELFELRTQMVKLVVGDLEPTMVCFSGYSNHTIGTRLGGLRRCYTLDELERNRFDARELMDYITNYPRGEHPDSG